MAKWRKPHRMRHTHLHTLQIQVTTPHIIWQITAMAQPNQHDKMCHNWTRTAPMPTVQSCWFWYIVACLQETFLVPYYDESWNIDTAKSHCRFRGHGFKPMLQLKKKFTHVWHLPCCQCTVTCSHVSSIQNNKNTDEGDISIETNNALSLIGPWEIWLQSQISKFQTHFNDEYLKYFLRNCYQVNATTPHWSLVNIGSGNGLMP